MKVVDHDITTYNKMKLIFLKHNCLNLSISYVSALHNQTQDDYLDSFVEYWSSTRESTVSANKLSSKGEINNQIKSPIFVTGEKG